MKVLKEVLKISGLYSIVILLSRIVNFFIKLHHETKTEVISQKGLKIVSDPKKALRLREIIYKYHSTGYWDKLELQKLIAEVENKS